MIDKWQHIFSPFDVAPKTVLGMGSPYKIERVNLYIIQQRNRLNQSIAARVRQQLILATRKSFND